MNDPDWFVLIQDKRKGGYGVGLTLPFIVGALAYKSGETDFKTAHIQDVLDQMINSPVDGFRTVVQWCHNIDAPVFSVELINDVYKGVIIKSSFPRPEGNDISLGFSPDLHSSIGGLDCKDAQECYEKLLSYAEEHVKNGHFSRNRSRESRHYEYKPFQENDLKFIRETIMQ